MALLVPGSNCWRIARAARLSMIGDAGPCFAHMADAIEAAQSSVFIIGWDLDSRTFLRPDASDPADRLLLPLLRRALERRPQLHVYVLSWDFSFIYAFEREPAPRRQFGTAHRRLHFALDSDHGSGGSHHQKLLVVDDTVAFVGGIDLTLHRWDMPEHAAIDPRRVDGEGKPYGPFHEVEMAVAGPAAAALGELARSRWNGRRPQPPTAVKGDIDQLWPRGLPVDVADVDVALARTLTRPGAPAVREIEAATTGAIAAAQRTLYAENQYLTSRVVVRALGERLEEADGPEVLLVLPDAESGWMEQSSMGLLREEALAALRARDRHGRLRVLSPVTRTATGDVPIAVHSKVLVIDDRIAKVGSANFSNRSMGLDSECDLIVDSEHQSGSSSGAATAFVASVRDRLLAEHLGLAPEVVAAAVRERGGSLCRLVDDPPASATATPRALVPLTNTCVAPLDFTLLDGAMVDPPEPWNADLLLKRAFPLPLRRRLLRRWLTPVALALVVIGGWAALRAFDPGAQHLRAAASAAARYAAQQPAGPALAMAAVIVGSALFIPITVLITTVLAVFGFWPGIAIAWVGATGGAMASHACGGLLGPRILSWLPERAQAALRRFAGKRSFWSVVLVRLLPVGNFGVMNLLAGAIGVKRRSFLFGNMVGLLPGLLGLGLFADRAIEAVRHPNPVNIGVVALVVAVGIASGILLKRRLDRKVAGGAA
jgi:phospholipase D1/2